MSNQILPNTESLTNFCLKLNVDLMHNNLTRVIIFTFNFHLCVNISDEHDPYLLQVPTILTVKNWVVKQLSHWKYFNLLDETHSVWGVVGGAEGWVCSYISRGSALWSKPGRTLPTVTSPSSRPRPRKLKETLVFMINSTLHAVTTFFVCFVVSSTWIHLKIRS